ncbi:nuclear transport factor 2 family protein [Dermatobacter hominis]|uniref:nuclear transport factor 2 family protein n=1 Tax=Dermatobacter hominis TaxID=2884263 RepID=UPI001D1215B9|nr:nuclear transport factor 2 family protein [Dermatobacter hominis]UDY37586.1 nuclear transport factor 2 family protein [Dermatobacter hominis]
MEPSPVAIASAFSLHRFGETYEHLSPDIRWRNVGGDEHVGRDEVVATCDRASAYFAGIDATVSIDRTITAGDDVVVETTGTYVEGGSTAVVASCDVYGFRAGLLVSITSYNVDLGD